MDYVFALLIPIVLSVFAWIIWPKLITWWETLLPVVIGLLFAFGTKSCMQSYDMSDTEYLTTHMIKAVYEEPWDEWIKKTCSYTTCSGSGKSRTCTTHYYDCSYREFHPAQWYLVDAYGHSYGISKGYYDKLTKEWGNNHFQEMNRHYYTQDGDAYVTDWDQRKESVIASSWSQSYTNKIQAAHSIYNFKELSDSDRVRNKLFEYPQINGYSQNPIMSYKTVVLDRDQRVFDELNAILGPKKQVKVFMLIWEDMPQDVARLQETYWKGSNKNELIICVGVDKIRRVKWAYIFTWSDKSIVKISIRNYLNENKGKWLDIPKLEDFVFAEVDKDWVRKNWKEFDFLRVELTDTQLYWMYFIVAIVSLGCLAYGVLNDHKSKVVDDTPRRGAPKRQEPRGYRSVLQSIRRRIFGPEIS